MPGDDAVYLGTGDRLSQGDLVRLVPWGLIDSPLTVCRPNDAAKTDGKAFYAPHDLITQGGAAFTGGRVETVHAQAKTGIGLVLWHDCEIDKFEEKKQPPEKWFAAVAPVIPTSGLPLATLLQVKEYKRRQFFPLPAMPSVDLPESYADLRYIWSIKQSLLNDRIAALSELTRAALHDHLFDFLTHRRLREALLCPSCHATLRSNDFFDLVE